MGLLDQVLGSMLRGDRTKTSNDLLRGLLAGRAG